MQSSFPSFALKWGYSAGLTVECECNVAIRVQYYYTALHVGFTFLVPMSNCMQYLIFFTCVSFVLYLKLIKYQIYHGLIFYLSLNDSSNLKSTPTIAIIKRERKKERK